MGVTLDTVTDERNYEKIPTADIRYVKLNSDEVLISARRRRSTGDGAPHVKARKHTRPFRGGRGTGTAVRPAPRPAPRPGTSASSPAAAPPVTPPGVRRQRGPHG